MQCWSCGTVIEDHKISCREVCESCNAFLHCCKNCRFYQIGLANDCKIPGTERISDREKGNFCDDFSPLGTFAEKVKSSSKKFDDLFK